MKVYVPLNENGIKELELLKEVESPNLKIFIFKPDDYFYLESHHYFDFLNVECDCLIDLYEDENISNDKLSTGLNITKILITQTNDERLKNLLNIFIEIFKLAINSKTYVNIYCYGNDNLANE